MTLQPHPGCCLPGTCLLLEFSMTLQPHPGSWSGTCRVLALNFTSCAAARAFRWFCIALHELRCGPLQGSTLFKSVARFLPFMALSWHHLCLIYCVGPVGPVAGLLRRSVSLDRHQASKCKTPAQMQRANLLSEDRRQSVTFCWAVAGILVLVGGGLMVADSLAPPVGTVPFTVTMSVSLSSTEADFDSGHQTEFFEMRCPCSWRTGQGRDDYKGFGHASSYRIVSRSHFRHQCGRRSCRDKNG